MRIPIALVAALLLTGCGPLDLRGTEWKKAGTMFQEVSLVEVECARKSFEIGPGPDLVLGGLLDVVADLAEGHHCPSWNSIRPSVVPSEALASPASSRSAGMLSASPVVNVRAPW